MSVFCTWCPMAATTSRSPSGETMNGQEQQDRTVFVSGCFDLMHSGHIEMFRQAAEYGRLHVAVGSDQTVAELKGRRPVCSESERLFMVRAVRYVAEAFVSAGKGMLDFEDQLRQITPDVFVVKAEGDHPAKRELCEELGIQYVVLGGVAAEGLPQRRTSWVRDRHLRMPYRIEIAGGWLDQPRLSTMAPGPVICAAIRPDARFYPRSGLATSTRDRAITMWGGSIPKGSREELARMLFCYDNPPGTTEHSGSQDAIGLVMPGVKKMNYAGRYWPESIETLDDAETVAWLQRNLFLLPVGPRPVDCNVLDGCRPEVGAARRLAAASENVWLAIKRRDADGLGRNLTETFVEQLDMFPAMVNDQVNAGIDSVQCAVGAAGFAVSGAGAGGYLIVITNSPTGEMIEVEIVIA